MKTNEYYQTRTAHLTGFSSQRARTVLQFAAKTGQQRGHIEAFLDIACSDGELTSLQKDALKADRGYGIDISPLALEAAAKRGIEVSMVSVETDEFPYRDEMFDVVFACDIIEHLFDCEKMLQEIHRVLKNGGALILSTPNLASWYNRLGLALGFQPFATACSLRYTRAGKPGFSTRGGRELLGNWGGEHIRVMTLSALKSLLAFYGFDTKETAGAHIALNDKESSFLAKGAASADRMFSLWPSLSTWVVVKAIKGGKTR